MATNQSEQHLQPTISQINLTPLPSPNLNYRSVMEEMDKHDNLYLSPPSSLVDTLREMIEDTEKLNVTNNFNFAPVLAILAKIEHLNPIDKKNGFKIQEILPKVWRFVKHYNMMNKIMFYDTLASISTTNNATLIGATLIMFYVPHIKNTDQIYHKLYHPNF